jgi:hypothetical protein
MVARPGPCIARPGYVHHGAAMTLIRRRRHSNSLSESDDVVVAYERWEEWRRPGRVAALSAVAARSRPTAANLNAERRPPPLVGSLTPFNQ